MNTMTRLLVIACLVLPFTACKKEEAPKAEVAAPLSAPTTDDVTAWRAYVNDVATRNMDGVNNSPFVYFLPSEKAVVHATCAFMIVDVRTGFVYGTGETTATEDQRSNIWGTAGAIEAARLSAERRAYEQGLGEVETLWASIVTQYGSRSAS